MPEKNELQRNFSIKVRRLLRRTGVRYASNAISVDTTTLRMLRTWDSTGNYDTVTVWHRKVCVYEEMGGEMSKWAPRSAMESAYDALCRHMVLDELADV